MNFSETRQQLPVYQRKTEIIAALTKHQVVVISGETGSGKTTQLPQFCLEIGRGQNGKLIGHTQPRRLAARSVAQRIADEQGTKLGERVGYQVRFTDQVSKSTQIKLMTDGILLAEIRSDPKLQKYDTIIVDEAHERSLNIDFIIGFLAQLLPKRPDLKVVITSATIDADRFALHFSEALGGRNVPVLEVSGRTYPVEIRYRPLDPAEGDDSPVDTEDKVLDLAGDVELAGNLGPATKGRTKHRPNRTTEPIDQITGICRAVDELITEGPGDILVFLAGERDIRDTEQGLAEHLGARYTPAGERNQTVGAVEVVPLYSRLSPAQQQVVFQPHAYTRIVLATNVAETSLTVPGIKYVIDPGLARISRYSNRTKVQRLPIEEISQASANQRSGRCGRISAGIAIRLYSQENYQSRPEYTEPEILRTSLASVILSMASLKLGKVADFPFIDAPDPRAVKDGEALLLELGALRVGAETDSRQGGHNDRGEHGHGRDQNRFQGRNNHREDVDNYQLTGLGRRIAAFPIDPRLARMIIAADRAGCVSDVLVIVAALSMQDVRLRPVEKQQHADQLHNRFLHPDSDFLTYLNLWRYLRTMQKELSGRGFRRLCEDEFLHYLRTREWQDLVSQLRRLATELGITVRSLEHPHPSLYRGSVLPHHQGLIDACCLLTNRANTDGIHRSLLSGMLSHLGNWDLRKKLYQGARGTQFTIWPGSALADRTFDWVMAHELVETSRLFARSVAKIDPNWIEKDAGHLLKRTYTEVFWSSELQSAQIRERVTLFGLTITADRPRSLASIPAHALPDLGKLSIPAPILAIMAEGETGSAPTAEAGSSNSPFSQLSKVLPGAHRVTPKELARLFFLYYQFVLPHSSTNPQVTTLDEDSLSVPRHRDSGSNQLASGIQKSRRPRPDKSRRRNLGAGDYPFQQHNAKAWEQAAELEKRTRQAGILPSDTELLRFYHERVGQAVSNPSTFARWWRQTGNSKALDYPLDFLLGRGTFPRRGRHTNSSSPLNWSSGTAFSHSIADRLPDLADSDTLASTSTDSSPAIDFPSPTSGSDNTSEADSQLSLLATLGLPDRWQQDGISLPITYRYAPGEEQDGLTISVALTQLARLDAKHFQWLVPGMWLELFAALLKGLPKTIRRQLGPSPDLAQQMVQWITEYCRKPQPVKPVKATPAQSKQANELASSLARLARWAGQDASVVNAASLATQTDGNTNVKSPVQPVENTVQTGIETTDRTAEDQKFLPAWNRALCTVPPHSLQRLFCLAIDHLTAVPVTAKDFEYARQHLPTYLQIRFRVRVGKNWHYHRDLEELQKKFSKQAQQASRNSLQAALEQAQAGDRVTSVRGLIPIVNKQTSPRDVKTTVQAISKSLAQGEKARDLEAAIREFNAADLTDWPVHLTAPLPDPVVCRSGNQSVRLYPALHPTFLPSPGGLNPITGETVSNTTFVYPASFPIWEAEAPTDSFPAGPVGPVSLRLWARSDWAARLHRWGTAELLTKQLALSPARISSRWSGTLSLQLSLSPYGHAQELVAALQSSATLALLDRHRIDTWEIRDAQSFQRLVQVFRDEFEDEVYAQAKLCAEICHQAQEVHKLLDQSWPITAISTVRAVQSRFRKLFYPGFLRDYQEQLDELPRYMQMLAMRLSKARTMKDPNWDSSRQAQVEAAEELWLQAQKRLTKVALLGRPLSQVDLLHQGQILLWEWQVSLFAQQLRTKEKVSYQRISKLLAKI